MILLLCIVAWRFYFLGYNQAQEQLKILEEGMEFLAGEVDKLQDCLNDNGINIEDDLMEEVENVLQ
jgi:hypothetical protein